MKQSNLRAAQPPAKFMAYTPLEITLRMNVLINPRENHLPKTEKKKTKKKSKANPKRKKTSKRTNKIGVKKRVSTPRARERERWNEWL